MGACVRNSLALSRQQSLVDLRAHSLDGLQGLDPRSRKARIYSCGVVSAASPARQLASVELHGDAHGFAAHQDSERTGTPPCL